MQRSTDKGGDGQTVRERNAKDVVAGGLNRADADEDESEGADEFCDTRSKFLRGGMEAGAD